MDALHLVLRGTWNGLRVASDLTGARPRVVQPVEEPEEHVLVYVVPRGETGAAQPLSDSLSGQVRT